jgi:hypothetical protein
MQKIACAAALAAGLGSLCAAASAQTVTINGAPQSFNPGPVERAGRIFVPLRGIFERLGATVVYSNGTINATGSDGRTVSVQIGSTQATVNGSPATLDVAPFVIGASAFVPLRFVSQALGATVAYDSGSDRVDITAGGGAGGRPPAPARNPVGLTGEQPARGAVVTSRRPTVAANFTREVDPNSVRVSIDGLDVTAQTTRSQTGIVYAPPSPLQSTEHQVRVEGSDRDGRPFQGSWRFTTGAGSVPAANFINIERPGDGSSVPTSFSVRGTTRPNARVRITAGAAAGPIPGFSFGTGSYTGDTIADSSGNFRVDVSINGIAGGSVGLTVVSTDVQTGETAQARLRLRFG